MNENYGKANDPQRISYYDIHEWNLDKTVKPHTMVRGCMGKDTGGTWRYLRVSSSGAISNDDAANFRVSSLGTSPDAADFRVSAIGGTAGDGTLVDGLDQSLSAMMVSSRSVDFSGLNLSATPQLAVRPGTEDAGELRVSAFQEDAGNLMVSSKSDDAALFRVSAVGGTAGDNTIVDGEAQTVSANLVVSARSVSPTSSQKGLVVAGLSPDAQYFRVSSTETNPITDVSAHIQGGSIDNASFAATQPDAGLFRVSSVGDNSSHILVDGLSHALSAVILSSRTIDAFTVCGVSVTRQLMVRCGTENAGEHRVCAIQGDAAKLHVSVVGNVGTTEASPVTTVSAHLMGQPVGVTESAPVTAVSSHLQGGSIDNTSFAATQGDAANLDVSAKSLDAGTLHCSAYPAPMATFFTSAIAIGTSGNQAIVNGAASKVIKIYNMVFSLTVADKVKWRTGSTDLTGYTVLSASAGYVANVNPPAFLLATTSAGQDLNMYISAAGVSAGGWLCGWVE